MIRQLASISLTIALITSCNFKDNEKVSVSVAQKIDKRQVYKNDSLTNLLNSNKQYFKDSLLKDKLDVIDNYFSKYQSDTCGIITYKNSVLKDEFDGIRIIKGIKTSKPKDTVFVIPNFNFCDDGQSYYFFDKTLPRLYTDSYCCHPDNFFVCPDIDEDGINEIGIFYSSCSSRYKSLRIYSLPKESGGWKEIGRGKFDVMTKDPRKVKYSDLIKKIRKDKFQICNFSDGQTEWETLIMK
jgi:hypothetical protein